MTPQRVNFHIVVPTPADRLAALQEEAAKIAKEQVAELIEAIEKVGKLADEAANSSLIAVGVREEARRLTLYLSSSLLTIKAIEGRG